MKRGFTLATLAVLLTGLVLLAALALRSPGPSPTLKAPSIPNDTVPIAAKAGSEANSGQQFPNFPLDQKQLVSFVLDDVDSTAMTRREIEDQLRDWLLYAVAPQTGLTADEMNRALYDLPSVRRGFLRRAGNYEHGVTRSLYLKNGHLIAVVPKSNVHGYREHIAIIADEYRKATGEKPTKITPFEYELEAGSRSACLTRRAELAGVEAFSHVFGYHEESPENIQQFATFVANTDYVTYASIAAGRLTLGGRKHVAKAYTGLRVEDIAVVWKAQAALKKTRDAFDAKWQSEFDQFNDRWRRIAQELEDKYRNQLIMPTVPKSKLPYRFDPNFDLGQWDQPAVPKLTEDFKIKQEVDAFLKQKNRELDELNARYLAAARTAVLKDGTGFSLDPTFDFEALAYWFNSEAALELSARAQQPGAPITTSDILAAKAGFKKRNADDLMILLGKLKSSKSFSDTQLFRKLDKEVKMLEYQTARYDGDLQGTEVGMILFFTDLIAKFWAGLNFLWNPAELARDDQVLVEDFKSYAQGGQSPIYREQRKFQSNTRLWFGPEDRGYALAPGRKSCLFSRDTTRLFAASSDPYFPGIEMPPTAVDDAVLGWWNDHYDSIAAFEPQYQRLNCYMKWSLLISWLIAENSESRLAFLNGVNADNKAWFPDWAGNKTDLHFNDWKAAKFFDKGAKGSNTESLPIISSRPFFNFGESATVHTMAGGVSGGNPYLLKKRFELPSSIHEQTKLSIRGIDPESLRSGKNSIEQWQGTSYSFRTENKNGAEQKVIPQFKLLRTGKLADKDHTKVLALLRDRGIDINGAEVRENYVVLRTPLPSRHAELRQTEITSKLTKQLGDASWKTTVGTVELCSLKVSAGKQGVTVRLERHDLDRGLDLLRRLSRSTLSAEQLAVEPNVEAFYAIGNQFLIKPAGSAKWLMTQVAPKETVAIPEGWEARVADTSTGARILLAKWVTSKEVLSELDRSEYLVITIPRENGRSIQASAGGGIPPKPPSGSRVMHFMENDGGGKKKPSPLNGLIDSEVRLLYFNVAKLPPEVRTDPALLFRWLNPSTLKTLAKSETSMEMTLTDVPPAKKSGVVEAFLAGDFSRATSIIAENPEAARQDLAWHKVEARLRLDRLLAAGRRMEAESVVAELVSLHGKKIRLEPEALAGLASVPRRASLERIGEGEARRYQIRGTDGEIVASLPSYQEAVDVLLSRFANGELSECIELRGFSERDADALYATYRARTAQQPRQRLRFERAETLTAAEALRRFDLRTPTIEHSLETNEGVIRYGMAELGGPGHATLEVQVRLSAELPLPQRQGLINRVLAFLRQLFGFGPTRARIGGFDPSAELQRELESLRRDGFPVEKLEIQFRTELSDVYFGRVDLQVEDQRNVLAQAGSHAK